MKLLVCAIKDTCIGEYMNPILMHNEEEAKRTFAEAINSGNKQSNICKNYKDMQMYALGEYDVKTGEIVSNVKFIANGVDVKEAVQPIPFVDVTPKVGEDVGV